MSMTELEQMTAAGGTLKLGERTLLLRQLTLRDFGQIQAWVRSRQPRPFAIVAEALTDLEPLKKTNLEAYQQIYEKLLLAAMEDKKRGDAVGADPQAVQDALSSPEGIAFVVWLSIRGEQPDVNQNEVEKWLLDCDLRLVKARLDELNLFQEDEQGADPKKAPAAA